MKWFWINLVKKPVRYLKNWLKTRKPGNNSPPRLAGEEKRAVQERIAQDQLEQLAIRLERKRETGAAEQSAPVPPNRWWKKPLKIATTVVLSVVGLFCLFLIDLLLSLYMGKWYLIIVMVLFFGVFTFWS